MKHAPFSASMIALALFALAIIAALSPGARVPRYREPLRPPIVGDWQMTWRSWQGPVCFAADGYYAEFAGQERSYFGSWSLSADRLRVHSARLWPDGSESRCDWEAELAPGLLSGTLQGGGTFALSSPPSTTTH